MYWIAITFGFLMGVLIARPLFVLATSIFAKTMLRMLKEIVLLMLENNRLKKLLK